MTNDGFDANARGLSVAVSVHCTRDVSGSHVTWIWTWRRSSSQVVRDSRCLAGSAQVTMGTRWYGNAGDTPRQPRLPLCLRTEVLTETHGERALRFKMTKQTV